MDKKQASSIIKDAFGSVFSRDKFIGFIGNLLNLNSVDFLHRNISIYDAYKQHVQSLEVVAKFNDGQNKIDVLIVTLVKDTSLDKARTMQRNFIARYLNEKQGDAALVAFTSPDAEDWRFSLIKMDLGFKKTNNGIKVEQEFTPAKRWSFLVGKNENSHTAQSQLVGILANDEVAPVLDELEQAFSIETVTNEFYEKYTDLFLRMKEALDTLLENDSQLKTDFKEKDVDTADFAKKTMGQMAFLYFLQKKGWFGVAPEKEWGTGVKNFLREIFERREKYGENFFDDVLEPLFYKALAQDRSDKNDIYSELNDCRMPFLNGGLFEPMNGYSWSDTHIRLPDELFSNNTKTKEGDFGDGILDVFDRYNFTVNESEPLEQEVAVDPEMLGKVFENLLPENLRRGRGAFYTPREIVHYMCQESLINYLETETNNLIPKTDIELFIQQGSQIIQNDKSIIEQGGDKGKLLLPQSISDQAEELDDLLANIKVCDPAVGSGAFPLGMLNEIVTARTILGIHLKNNPSAYKLKLHAISNSIYGVDIDPGAVEIAKLRFWLSLVVEEDNPTPLPNLEHKIMQGNSLVSQYEGIELFDDDFLNSAESVNDEKNEIQEKLDEIQKEYFSLHSAGEFTTTRKVEIEEEIKRLQRRLKFLNNKNTVTVETGSLFDVPHAKKIAQQKAKLLQSKITRYVTVDSKTNKESLKLEIDNLKWDLIEATLEERGEIDKLDAIKKLRKERIKPFFIWKLEFGDVFKNNGGFDLVIGNPPYIQLQKSLDDGTRNKHADLYKNCGYTTFKRSSDIYVLFYELGVNVLKDNGHLTYITSNKWMRAGYGDVLRGFFARQNPKKLLDFAGFKVFESATVDVNIALVQKTENHNKLQVVHLKDDYREGDNIINYFNRNNVELTNLNDDTWIISGKDETTLREKIEGMGTPLKDWDVNISRGIITGYNTAFIIDEDKRIELITQDSKSEEIIKPILRGKDIKRYGYEPSNMYVILAKYGSNKYLSEKYPAVFLHLSSHKEKLSKRGQCTNKDGRGQHHWLELDNNPSDAYLGQFLGEKMIYPNMTKYRPFFMDSEGFLTNQKCFIMTGRHMKYLTGLLNSWLFDFAFKDRFPELLGGTRELSKIFFVKLRIPPVISSNNALVKEIEELVEARIDSESESLNIEIEAKIDKLVYQLYDLTDEDIAIVEKASN